MSVVNVRTAAGTFAALEAVEGWRLMEILREHGLPIEGICGGACACASCHVVVAPEWADRLHPARDDEEDKLDEVANLSPTSRLSCQIIWDDTLSGLEIEIPGDEGALDGRAA